MSLSTCKASYVDFYAYADKSRVKPNGQAACPMCGKLVKLGGVSYSASRMIPKHNTATMGSAS